MALGGVLVQVPAQRLPLLALVRAHHAVADQAQVRLALEREPLAELALALRVLQLELVEVARQRDEVVVREVLPDERGADGQRLDLRLAEQRLGRVHAEEAAAVRRELPRELLVRLKLVVVRTELVRLVQLPVARRRRYEKNNVGE